MAIQPYLFFDGRCDEAIEFYRRALGAELAFLMRFKDGPDPTMVAPGTEDKVMHATLRVGDATVLLSDGSCGGRPSFQGFALSSRCPTRAKTTGAFAPGAGGRAVALAKTFSPRFAWSPTLGV